MRAALVAALLAHPTAAFADATTARGQAALGAGKLPEALAAFKEAGDEGLGDYAEALALSGVYEPALAVLEAAQLKDPTDPRPYAAAGWVFFYAGYSDVASDLWRAGEDDQDSAGKRAAEAVRGINTIGVVGATAVDAAYTQKTGGAVQSGVLITLLAPGPPAVRGTLEVGDVVMSIDGAAVTRPEDLAAAVRRAQPGQRLGLTLWRKGGALAVFVPVASTHDVRPLAAGKEVPKPTQDLLDRVDWADFLLLEHHPFQAALAYRRLIDRSPGWYLPYLNYSMALEEVGALSAAKGAMRIAMSLPQPELDADARSKLEERRAAVEKTSEPGKEWRTDQPIATDIAGDRSIGPSLGYIGFAGGQLTVASTVTFGISARVGHLFSNGLDASVFLTWNIPSTLQFGGSVFQRLYVPPTTKRVSFNLGVSGSVATTGTVLLGPMVGASFFVGPKRDKSFDVSASLSLLSGTPIVTGTFGVTQFFGT